MTSPVFFADTLAKAALDRLRAGVAAAMSGQPLFGVHIPPTRHQEVPPGKMAALFCYAAREQGRGFGHSIPQFELTDTLYIDGFVAQGREAATDLDQACGTLIQAVLDLLLEDTTFLQLFGLVESVNVDKQDVQAGKDALEYDLVEFRIELVLEGGQTTYAPATPAAATSLATIGVVATVGDATVEADIPNT